MIRRKVWIAGLPIFCTSHLFCVLLCNALASLGYIDLSKRRVSPEEAIKCEDKFTKSKTVSMPDVALFILKREFEGLVSKMLPVF